MPHTELAWAVFTYNKLLKIYVSKTILPCKQINTHSEEGSVFAFLQR